jgi:hypothetical protein
MKRLLAVISVLASAGVGLGLVASAGADDDHDRNRPEVVRARLVSFNEVPAVSSAARGFFRAVIDEAAGTITYSLSYDGGGTGLATVLQSHLHLGQHHTNGGISVWLCGNASTTPPVNPPAGTQPCPPAPAEITGVIMAANVTGPAGQGIAAGEFAELLAAIRSGAVYANAHSVQFPGGEIRGQVN